MLSSSSYSFSPSQQDTSTGSWKQLAKPRLSLILQTPCLTLDCLEFGKKVSSRRCRNRLPTGL